MTDYNLEGPRWAGGPISWSFALANFLGQAAYTTITATFNQVSSVFANDVIWAFQRWSQVTNLQFVQASDSSNVDIRLGWAYLDGAGSVAGISAYNYDFGGHFLADDVVEFDSGDTWVLGSDGDYHAGNAFGTSFRAIALHEIGHELGLDHYSGAVAIMNPVISPSVTDLTQHDINGIQALYGALAQSVGGHPHSDINGDGFSDIVWQYRDGSPYVWSMSGSTYLGGYVPANFNPGTNWQIKETADFNGDGRSDILWQNIDGTPCIWTMNGSTLLSSVVPANYNPGTNWQIKAAADFNGDGDADILWQNKDGTPCIWMMNGSTLLSSSIPANYNPGTSWKIKDAGDFNGDGKADILWQNTDGTPYVWLLNGSTFLGGFEPDNYNPGSNWQIKSADDFNGDGKADILWQNTDGTPYVWLMNGSTFLGGFEPANFNPGADWRIVA